MSVVPEPPGPVAEPPPAPRFGGRFDDEGPGLRQRTARGTLINAAFMVGLTSLGFVKGFAVAAFLTSEEYGLWGILAITLGSITSLALVGIGDKFIQQDEPDQEFEFQKAFTLDTMVNGVLLVVLIAATPLIAFVYDRPEVVVPGLVLTLALPVASLQAAPLWVFYRQMKFAKQRTFSSVNPIAAAVVTIAMAAAGYGYWSLVVGTVVGVWLGAIVGVLASPYRLRFRYDPGTLRSYYSFSWPLLVNTFSGLIVAQLAIFVGETELGLAGAGAITLASSIALYTNRVSGIVTASLYPAICAVKDKSDLLFESFVKSNRLALMWGVPFGVGLALFAPQLVEYVLGERWELAVGLIQAFGVIAALNHIGFNWDAFYRARGDTKPIAATAAITTVAFVVVPIPLLIRDGLDGFAIGMAVTTVFALLIRTYYLTKLFPTFAMLRHMARAIAPTVPPVVLILGLRAVEGTPGSASGAAAELAAYGLVTLVATYLFERRLLREVVSYVRGQRVVPT